MKNKALYLLPFLPFLLMTACYDVPYLIKPESEGIFVEDALGEWKSIKQTAQSRTITLSITRESSKTNWYAIKKVDYPTKEVRFLRALVHKVGEHLIFSYQDNKFKDFSIFRVSLDTSISPPQINAIALSEDAPRFKTKEEFINFLLSEDANSWFKDGYTFKKISENS